MSASSSKRATTFVIAWIDEHLDHSTAESDIPGLAARCEEDARNAGISPFKLVDETGVDIKAMIEAAHAMQLFQKPRRPGYLLPIQIQAEDTRWHG